MSAGSTRGDRGAPGPPPLGELQYGGSCTNPRRHRAATAAAALPTSPRKDRGVWGSRAAHVGMGSAGPLRNPALSVPVPPPAPPISTRLIGTAHAAGRRAGGCQGAQSVLFIGQNLMSSGKCSWVHSSHPCTLLSLIGLQLMSV